MNKSSEKQIALSWGNLQFRDSMCLMSGSLSKLIEDSRKGAADLEELFPTMRQYHPFCKDAEDLDLLTRKLPICYSSLNDPACFDAGYSNRRRSSTTT